MRRSSSSSKNHDYVVVETAEDHDNFDDHVTRSSFVRNEQHTPLQHYRSHPPDCDSSPAANVELASLLEPEVNETECEYDFPERLDAERRLSYGEDDEEPSTPVDIDLSHCEESDEQNSFSPEESFGTPKTKNKKLCNPSKSSIESTSYGLLSSGKKNQNQNQNQSQNHEQKQSQRETGNELKSNNIKSNNINNNNNIRHKSFQSLLFSPNNNNSPLSSDLSLMMMRSIPEESGSDEETEDPIMEAMDKIEDEIDGHAYDELIPLQIRMALEDQIFGWDHFLSNILGHVSFTVGSYLITYWIISYVVLREVPWRQHEHNTHFSRVKDGEDESRYSSHWGIPHEIFLFIRTALSLASAVSTYRTIRRRRRVWLRQPYGSVEYLDGSEAERRHASLEEADLRARRFVLGSKLWTKMQKSYMKRRDRYLTRGVNKKLLKAQRMFERRHRNRVKLIRSTSNSSLIASIYSNDNDTSRRKRALASALTRHGHEESHHERVRMLAKSGNKLRSVDSDLTSGDGDGDDAKSMSGSSYGVKSVDDYGGLNYQYLGAGIRDSRTLPNFAMESVSHDQMPFAHGDIKNIPYVHGGFFGAAPFMLTNPHWISILRILMPDVYVEISRRAAYAPAPKLIHWAENNPVVAAYGTAHELEFSGRVPTLEWDVFLDPYLVKRVEIVLNEKEGFLQRQRDSRKKAHKESHRKDDDHGLDVMEGENDDEVIGNPTPMASSNERLVLSYYNAEIRRRTELLAERMLIAHGNVAQLVLEQTGYLKKYNFSRVKRTRKTLGGGIFARQWLAVYADAMKFGMGVDDDDYDDDCESDTDSTGAQDDVNFEDGAGIDHNAQIVAIGGHHGATSPDAKSATNSSLEESVSKTPGDDRSIGPPRKIVMMRSNEDDDDISIDGSITSELTSPQTAFLARTRKAQKARSAKKKGQQRVDSTSLNALAKSICPDYSIKDSIDSLKHIIQCPAPFGLVLDMKSRHVSRKVWALVIDFLRDAGARVEGIASFFVEEVRDISKYCNSPVNEIVFAHSAGDIQLGCHDGRIRRGDKVFFNAGSLLWDYPNIFDVNDMRNILEHRMQICFYAEDIKQSYRLKAYAKTTKPAQYSPKNQNIMSDDESETCAESADDASTGSDLFTKLLVQDRIRKSSVNMDFTYEEVPGGVCSTIQEYKNHYNLKIGLYVQEFAIDDAAVSLIVKYVNANPHVYELGLSWGGINGLTVRGIQPGRFTATDGLWNQRYAGMPWREDLKPSDESTT